MEISFSNPVLLVIGGIILLGIIYLWNRSNSSRQRQRRRRSFRSSYLQKKKERKE